MPTPSNIPLNSEFGVGEPPPRRSIFENYEAADPSDSIVATSMPVDGAAISSDDRPLARRAAPIQSEIDTALALSYLCRFLAKAFEDPDPEGWRWLTGESTKSDFWLAVTQLAPAAPASFADAARELTKRFELDAWNDFHHSYVECFGHTVRGDCPMNEIEYADIKADPLFQPHRLADISAFYVAFGLEMAPDAAERQDHISIELEFLSVLAAKEAYAMERQFDDEKIDLCREARKKFLREHLGRWAPAFARGLARMAGDTPLGALAGFLREYITEDCSRLNIAPGSEDLLFRPIDESSESLCASCGITNLPPGAVHYPSE